MSTPLWAPWRMPYLEGVKEPKDKGCFFCEYQRDVTTFRENLVVVMQDHALVVLNRYPFAPSHVLVTPRRHVPDIKDLSDEEYLALMTLLRETRIRLERAVKCPAMNIGFNLGAPAGAGVADHVHGHLVPRWPNDTNFMPVIAGVHVMPQALDETWQRLRIAFDDLPGQKAAFDPGVAP